MINRILSLLNLKQKKEFFLIIFLIILATIIEIFSLGIAYNLIKVFINGSLDNLNTYLVDALYYINVIEINHVIKNLTIFLLLIYLFKFFYLILFFKKQNYFVFKLRSSISDTLLKKYFNQDYIFFVRKNSSELIRNIKEEVNAFGIGVINQSINFFADIILILGIVIFIFYVNVTIASIVVFLFTIILILYYFFIKSFLYKLGKKRQETSLKYYKNLNQIFQGIKEIKLYKSENYYFNIFSNSNNELGNISAKTVTINQIPKLGIEIFLIILISTFILNIENLGFSDRNSLELIGLFALASFRLMPAASKILVSMQLFRLHKASIELLYKEINLNDGIGYSNKNESKLDFKNKISIKNLNYRYNDQSKFELNNINFEINKNEIVGIIGESGSGKSTFLDILVGLLNSNEGEIKIDEKNVKENLISYQNRFGYISQFSFILDDSIYNNITFGKKISDSTESVYDIIKNVQLSEYVNNLKDGIDTNIGEKGAKISGGQIQRVAIARALYRNPDILILDEATSALDENTENEILKIFKENLKSQTILIVSHRENTMAICDKIYRMEKGKLKLLEKK
jgi:ABC-type multidrug transport system fused ATPase/permease subunit